MNEPLDQLEPIPRPLKPKMPLGKVLLINLGIMLIYVLSVDTYSMELRILIIAFLVAIQVSLNLVTGIILLFSRHLKHVGKALLTGGLITGIIGFGACLAAKKIFL